MSSAPSGPIVRPSTVTPSRKSAPAAAACSARKASSRRRCVIRTSGASLRPLEALPVAEAHLEASARRPRRRGRRRTAARARPARSPRRRTACRAGSGRGRRAGPALPRARAGSPWPSPQAPRRRRSRRTAPPADRTPLVRLHSALAQGCPSGQRERAVNPPAQPTKVRILPPAYKTVAQPWIGICGSRSRSAPRPLKGRFAPKTRGPERGARLPRVSPS